MIYKLVLTEEAEKQLLQWRKSGQKKDFQKILSLFQELEKHPTTGTGQVEALKGSLSGYWSRRINISNIISFPPPQGFLPEP